MAKFHYISSACIILFVRIGVFSTLHYLKIDIWLDEHNISNPNPNPNSTFETPNPNSKVF